MAVRKPVVPGSKGFTRRHPATQASEAKATVKRVTFKGTAAPIDVDALFADTMARFPKTMARLAE